MASCFIVLAAQAQFNLTGTVTDESGKPLAGANLLITGSLSGVSSGSDGRFTFNNLKAGNYLLQASFVGYERKEVPVAITGNTEITINLSERMFMADEVVVRATRADQNSPVAYTNISREEIQQMTKVQDVPYLLALTPSVTLTSDGGLGVGYSGLRIRGTDPTRINVTLNGIPFNDSESHEVYWVDIPDVLASTDNIQVQRGVGTSTQGAAAFGANINLKTDEPEMNPHASVSLSAGSFNTLRSSLSAGTGLMGNHWNIETRVSRIHTDGFIDRAFANLNSMALTGGYYSKRNVIRASLLSGYERTYQAWGGVPSSMLETNRTYNPYAYENEVDDYKQNHAQIHWSGQLSDALSLNVSLHFTKGQGYYEQYRTDEDLSSYGIEPVIVGSDTVGEADLVRRKWLDNQFFGTVYSLNWDRKRIRLTYGGGASKYSGDHFGRIIWSEFASTIGPDYNYYLSTGNKSEINQFVKADVNLFGGVSLFADLQGRFIRYSIVGNDDDLRDISQDHSYPFFNPKAGINWKITEGQRAFISYGIANREPKRSDFTDARKGSVPLPEQLRDLELGYDLVQSNFSGSVNVYWMDYTNQLVLTGMINDVGAPVMVNIPDSYRTGLELAAAWKVLRTLKLEGTLTLSKNKIRSFVEYVDDWDTGIQHQFAIEDTDLSFSPAVVSSGRITWQILKDLRLAIDSRFVGRQYIDNTSNPDRALDPYFVSNLQVSWSLHPKHMKELSFFVQVNNLLNEQYETNAWVYSYYYGGQRYKEDGYFPQAGIHFFTGLTATF
jgi:iron complex outermembrane receptor protein